MLQVFKQRGVQVVLTLTLYILTASYLPMIFHQTLYTISLFIKDLLVWMMPLIVIFFIAHTVTGFEKKAPLFVLALVLFEATSNFSSVMYSYLWGNLLTDQLPSLQTCAFDEQFTALWRLPFKKPAWWTADKGCLLGLVLGCIAALLRQHTLKHAINTGKTVVHTVLRQFFGRLIPVFVLGFVANMYWSGLLVHALTNYASLILWLILAIFMYVIVVFLIGAKGSVTKAVQHMHNMFPAWLVALSSGCSFSTMPFTIKGVSKNLDDPQLAEAIIPATTNIQQIGDCIVNSFLCFVLYKQFFGVVPDLSLWLNFTIVFVLARFATSAILGGAIFVMIPIYEHYLHFTPEMIAIIWALNVVLDPLVTSSNVIANGGLCRVFEMVWSKIGHRFFSADKTC